MPSWPPDPAARLREWVPRWWRGEGGAGGWLLDRALWPAEVAYRGIVGARNLAYDRGILSQDTPRIPVVSIGNLGVGGAGKTPFAAWVAGRAVEWGRRPAIVLRGYGADEVLVHRELNPGVPVIAAPRRAEGVERAAREGCDAAVLDDGFQHRALRRSLDIVLVAAESWRPPLRLLPRGPWRESRRALERAGVVVVTRKSAPAAEAVALAAELARGLAAPVAVCHVAPTRLVPLHAPGESVGLDWLSGRDLLAVASLADPRPFVSHLEEHGARVELLAFPDHHDFDAADAERIARAAGARPLAMTRKEAVKLRPLLPAGLPAMVLDQRVEVESGAAGLDRALREALS